MQTETQSSLSQHPSLSLSKVQHDIILAHAGDAVNQILAADFSKETEQQIVKMSVIFNQGRKAMAETLLNYDQELQAAIKKQLDEQNSQGEE